MGARGVALMLSLRDFMDVGRGDSFGHDLSPVRARGDTW